MRLLLRTIIVLTAATQAVVAQQEAQYTQYMYNMSIVNPGYTLNGVGDMSFGALHRNQWVGIEGNPTTTMAFGQVMLKNNLQVGVSFLNDNIGGIISENNMYADIAYKLSFSNNSFLSFGTKLGGRFFNANTSGLRLQSGGSATDIAFQENINRGFLNIGIGLYFNTEKFYVGISSPNLLEADYLENSTAAYKGGEQRHGFLTGGYIFDIARRYRLKPSFMLKAVRGSIVQLDLNANLLVDNKFEAGLSYRIQDALAVLVGVNINRNFKVGYSYDFNISQLRSFNSGSHEIVLIYKINSLASGVYKSPRFF